MNKEKRKEAQRKYRASHKEQRLEYSRQYRAMRPELERARVKRFRENHKQHFIDYRIRRRAELRKEVFDYYGQRCSWPGCNVDDVDMLQVDHVNGGGTRHRKEIGSSSADICKWLIEHNFPSGFRILCANHNWKHRANMARERHAEDKSMVQCS